MIMIHSVKVHFAEQDINDLKELAPPLNGYLITLTKRKPDAYDAGRYRQWLFQCVDLPGK